MGKVRVLQIVGKVVGGGVESVILNYYRYIDHEKFQFDFVVDGKPLPYFEKEAQKYGGKVFSVTPYSKNIFRYMMDIYHIVKQGNYDIIHSNMNTMSGFSLLAAQLAGAEIRILHNHATANKGEGIKTILKYILRPMAQWPATDYCACSERAAQWMYGNHWQNKCHIIYNAIDTTAFLFNKSKRAEMRQRLNIEESQMVLGHVGRFTYAKNHQFVLKVFRKVLTEKPDSILLLLGDGPLKQKMKEIAHAYGIDQHIYFLGVQNNVNEWLQAMDVFLFPSWYEGLGMAAVEAQMSGLPVLLSKFIPHEACILESAKVLPLDAEVWEKALIKMEINKQRGQEPSEDNHFDIKTETSSLEKYYCQLLKSIC